MSPVLCSRVALVLPHPSFPCVPGVPTVWVRAPVANTLGFAVLYKTCPGWLLSWFSLGAGLSGTFRLPSLKVFS